MKIMLIPITLALMLATASLADSRTPPACYADIKRVDAGLTKVICPVCKKEKRRSRVEVVSTTRTLMGTSSYYDEDGNYHYDDPNATTTTYRCGNDHWFKSVRQRGREQMEIMYDKGNLYVTDLVLTPTNHVDRYTFTNLTLNSTASFTNGIAVVSVEISNARFYGIPIHTWLNILSSIVIFTFLLVITFALCSDRKPRKEKPNILLK